MWWRWWGCAGRPPSRIVPPRPGGRSLWFCRWAGCGTFVLRNLTAEMTVLSVAPGPLPPRKRGGSLRVFFSGGCATSTLCHSVGARWCWRRRRRVVRAAGAALKPGFDASLLSRFWLTECALWQCGRARCAANIKRVRGGSRRRLHRACPPATSMCAKRHGGGGDVRGGHRPARFHDDSWWCGVEAALA